MAGTTVITAARLIDGTGSPAISDAAVVVEGEQITAVGARGAVAVPEGATTIDLGDRTILPGLVDHDDAYPEVVEAVLPVGISGLSSRRRWPRSCPPPAAR